MILKLEKSIFSLPAMENELSLRVNWVNKKAHNVVYKDFYEVNFTL